MGLSMQSPTRFVRFLSVFLPVCFCGLSVSAQTQTTLQGVVGGFDQQNLPSVLHVRHFDAPAVGLGEWVNVALVHADGSFETDLGNLTSPALFEFAAPPWSWLAIVRPGESGVLTLSPSSRASNRLMQVPGVVRWNGNHPSISLDSLARFQQRLTNELVQPMTVKSLGLQPLNSDSLEQVSSLSDSMFQAAWMNLEREMKQPVFEDLWWQAQWKWQVAIGSNKPTLDSLWLSWNSLRLNRDLEESLKSPGWIEPWFVRYDQWWKQRQVDVNGMSKAVYLADLDTLRQSMGPQWDAASHEDLAAAWLMKALSEPDELTFRIWETMPFPEPFRGQYKRLMDSRNPRKSGDARAKIRWTLPNGDLQSFKDVCSTDWKVMLVVRNGSGAALRERELFAEITENKIFSNICFMVLSVDATESDWRSSLSKRRSIQEQLVWLGNSPENFESFQISTIPQVIAISPNGQLSRTIRSLPSEGLGAELERKIRTSRSNY